MTPRPPNRVTVAWAGEERFDAGRPEGPRIRVDASASSGPSPVDALLIALGSCSAVDVVEILKKRRTPPERLEVEVIGHRVDGVPRRLQRAVLRFHVDGAGVERAHAERAIDLAVNKYCSVRDSLAPDISVEWELVLNGAAEAPAAAEGQATATSVDAS